MKPALLIIDMQEHYYGIPGAAEPMKNAAGWINAAIELFRAKQLPVIVIQHMNQAEGFVPGARGFDTHADIKLMPDDPRVNKTFGSGFAKTGLAELLRGLGSDTAIMTGFCAEFCVLSTYRGAEEHGIKAVILRNAIASYKPDRARFVEEISDTVTLGALQALLG